MACKIEMKQIPTSNADDRANKGNTGGWIRAARFDRDSAELNVWLLKDGQVRIKWAVHSGVGNAKTGNATVGEIDGIFPAQRHQVACQKG